ncbi:hypothetical protein GC163_11885 [bacterium]|nr:hypothetical protein [bacterium]
MHASYVLELVCSDCGSQSLCGLCQTGQHHGTTRARRWNGTKQLDHRWWR